MGTSGSGSPGWWVAWRRVGLRATTCGFLLAGPLSEALPGQERSRQGSVALTLEARARGEYWNWFGDAAGGNYAYANLLLRFGLEQERPTLGWKVEFAAPLVLGAPDDPAARGHGAYYYHANGDHRTVAQLFPKQVYFTLGRPSRGHRVRLGRFEFSEGGEVSPAEPTLAALKRRSVVQRLIGPFNFTQGARSLDGLEYGWARPGLNVTALAAVPTVGVFNLDGWSHVSEMPLGYAAVTGTPPWTKPAGEWRVFVAGYRDSRGLVPVDNRPWSARQADREAIGVVTLGGHLLQLLPTSSGPVDLALWGAWQTGEWGAQRHRAWAADVEAGWQPQGLPLRPWFRLGLFTGSGDRDSLDATHGTFFQMLATPRLYARFPFYNLMNVQDWSASVTLRPSARASVRADVRALRLESTADGWYGGSGPYDTRTFGLAIRPSTGASRLGTLIDASADLQLTHHWTLSVYGAVAPSGPVIRASAPSSSAGGFGFVELEYRR